MLLLPLVVMVHLRKDLLEVVSIIHYFRFKIWQQTGLFEKWIAFHGSDPVSFTGHSTGPTLEI